MDIEQLETRDIEKYCEDMLAGKKSAISTHRQFIGAMKQFKNIFGLTKRPVEPYTSICVDQTENIENAMELINSVVGSLGR